MDVVLARCTWWMALILVGCSKPALAENARFSQDFSGSFAELKRSLPPSSSAPRTPGDEALAHVLPKVSRVSYQCGGGTWGRSYIDYRVELFDGRSTQGRSSIKCVGPSQRVEVTFRETGALEVFTSGEERSVEYTKALSTRAFGDLRQVLGSGAWALEGRAERPSAEQVKKSWE